MINPGYLLINKPKEYTSYDCIRHLKKIIRMKEKIGHAGTLDPFATGLLIIAIGKNATKNINLLSDSNKEYIATGKLGILTDTLDLTGATIEEKQKEISKENLIESINSFEGQYNQTPPIYSALKHRGEALYNLARNKNISEEELLKIIKDKTRIVFIPNIELIEYSPPTFKIKTTVSKGTYIRSLINDIAKKLDTVAICTELIRTKIGNFALEESVNLENLKTIEDINKNIIPVEKMIEIIA
jgi:tRNA pseudouridine55 synthase